MFTNQAKTDLWGPPLVITTIFYVCDKVFKMHLWFYGQIAIEHAGGAIDWDRQECECNECCFIINHQNN